MFIKCWGARGSIPVSGKEYVKYGGDTACIEIMTKKGGIIIIDAGTGIKSLGDRLLREKKRNYNLLFTHVHWDHILGLPFFKPIYYKSSRIKIYGSSFAPNALQKLLARTMEVPYFPVSMSELKSQITFHGDYMNTFTIDSIEIIPIELSHPNHAAGFKFIEDGKSFVYLTDNELSFRHPGGREFKDYLEFSYGADLLIHDAECSEKEYNSVRGWGHSTYQEAIRLALEAKVKSFGLFHHNHSRTDFELDKIVENCEDIINKNNPGVKCVAIKQGMEIDL